ncbi:hypothetical protein [Streptomyces sp. NPDC004533]|uniref:hypothetical protein n=1 Tax=unclassified Streptomyces TaxID=2593676 RepID=UPI0033BD4BF2
MAAAASLAIVLAWLFSLGGSLLLRRSEVSGLLYALLALAVLVFSLALAYTVVRTLIRGRRRKFHAFGPWS